MEGIIYKYTSPSGKCYIGQTTDEKRRRRDFAGTKKYAGEKINRAIQKYGPDKFEYTVLAKITSGSSDEVRNILNVLEKEYIKLYDSMRSGYNSAPGGECYQACITHKRITRWSYRMRQKIKKRKL